MELSASLGWGAALALPDPNKGNRSARRASARWAQRPPPPSRLRALQVSRGEAGRRGLKEKCRGALRGSPSCGSRSRRPGLGMSVSPVQGRDRLGLPSLAPRTPHPHASLRTHNKPTCAGTQEPTPQRLYCVRRCLARVRVSLDLAHCGNRAGNQARWKEKGSAGTTTNARVPWLNLIWTGYCSSQTNGCGAWRPPTSGGGGGDLSQRCPVKGRTKPVDF